MKTEEHNRYPLTDILLYADYCSYTLAVVRQERIMLLFTSFYICSETAEELHLCLYISNSLLLAEYLPPKERNEIQVNE